MKGDSFFAEIIDSQMIILNKAGTKYRFNVNICCVLLPVQSVDGACFVICLQAFVNY